jgi:hypothetical protein
VVKAKIIQSVKESETVSCLQLLPLEIRFIISLVLLLARSLVQK